MTKIS